MSIDLITLNNQIAAACPIQGISIGTYTDNTTWSIQYDPSATEDQQAAGLNILLSYTTVNPVMGG